MTSAREAAIRQTSARQKAALRVCAQKQHQAEVAAEKARRAAATAAACGVPVAPHPEIVSMPPPPAAPAGIAAIAQMIFGRRGTPMEPAVLSVAVPAGVVMQAVPRGGTLTEAAREAWLAQRASMAEAVPAGVAGYGAILSHAYAQQAKVPGFTQVATIGRSPMETPEGYWPAAGRTGGTLTGYAGTQTTSDVLANIITGVGAGVATVVGPRGPVQPGGEGGGGVAGIPAWAWVAGAVGLVGVGWFAMRGRGGGGRGRRR